MRTAMPLGFFGCARTNRFAGFAVAFPDLLPGQDDANAKVDSGVAFELKERRAGDFRISFRVDGDDKAATALKQLIDSKVLDMAAITQIDKFLFLVEDVEHLEQQVNFAVQSVEGLPQPAHQSVLCAEVARVAQPVAEPDIEQSKGRRQPFYCVGPHIG